VDRPVDNYPLIHRQIGYPQAKTYFSTDLKSYPQFTKVINRQTVDNFARSYSRFVLYLKTLVSVRIFEVIHIVHRAY
jgi:hypothetical protein